MSHPIFDAKRYPQAFIIQHPNGDRKRLGFVRNLITSVDDRVIHYLTDTQQGASGQPPIKKNEGIRISRIVAYMQAMGGEWF